MAKAQQNSGKKTALIPRRMLFDDPQRSAARISPDGRWLSWLAPDEGVLNVWVAPVDDIAAARCVTHNRKNGVRAHRWTHDGRHFVYFEDHEGNEDYKVYAVDVEGGGIRNITPYERVHANPVETSPERPGTLAIGMNDRDARWHDLYEVDIASGERRLVFHNDQELTSFVLDRQFKLRIAVQAEAGGGFRVLRHDDGRFTEMKRIPPEDSLLTGYLSINASGNSAFMFSTIGRDKSALLRVDWATGKETLLVEHPKADIDQVLSDPVTDEPQAAGAIYLRREWKPLAGADAVGTDLALLAQRLKGEIRVVAKTADNRRWVVQSSRAEEPVTYHLFDRPSQNITPLFSSRPDLADAPLQPMHGLVIPARDGLELVCYLTLPTTPAMPRGRARRCPWCCWCMVGRGRARCTTSTPPTNGSPTAVTLCST